MQIRVNEGILEGERVNSDLAGTFYSFKGIPYAEPPVGDLRFKAPRPLKPWEGVRSAKEHGPQCPQYNVFLNQIDVGNEDCLYLNIYTPDVHPSVPLPVMIWIHGGFFSSGNGNDFSYGPEFLIRHGVILVTLNYRLGMFGFLCLDTEDIPGNAGAKDQVAAMKWVKSNISNFGGDPNNITIFGQSSGGACVTYHCVSPMTKGLFRRAISQSGTMMNWWAHCHKPRDRALAFAKQLGCTSEDDKEIYNFFKEQPSENFICLKAPLTWKEEEIEVELMQFAIVNEKRFPNIDPYFIGDVVEALKNDIHEGVDMIVGFNADDGAVRLGLGTGIEQIINSVNNSYTYFVPTIFSYIFNRDEVQEVGMKLKNKYTQGNTIVKEDMSPVVDFLSAETYKFGILQFAKYFSAKNKTYLYKFSCVSERNVFQKIFGINSYFTKTLVCHNEDLAYLFPIKSISQNISKTSDSFKMVCRMTKLWTNFAKNGNPTPDTQLGCNWRTFNAKTQYYLNIGSRLLREVAPYQEEMEFWENIYEKYFPHMLYPKI